MSPSPLPTMSLPNLQDFAATQRAAYDRLKDQGLSLDLTRGKPSAAQLDLSENLLTLPVGHTTAAGVDARNYGGADGLPELRGIFAELLGVDVDQIIAGGNSSLTMMSNTLTYCLLHGGVDSPRPWSQEEKVTFICPVPGYDRHFKLLESLGIDMVTVPMTEDGPDPAATAALVRDDPSIKGMWIVPTYSNPTGAVCTQEVAAALTSMPTAAPDFKILWDNAYAFHHLTAHEAKSADVLSLATAAGHPHRPVVFASTSKISLAGAGVAFLAGSTDTIAWYLRHQSTRSIGPDKINQLRHAQFFGDADGVRRHMARHRAIIAPKFAQVQQSLTEGLGGSGIAEWTDPTGGYFVSLDVLDGTATRVIALAKDAGVTLTAAGAAFPYRNDPRDCNIRIAPTMPPLEDVTAAMRVLVTCVLLAAAEALIERSQSARELGPR